MINVDDHAAHCRMAREIIITGGGVRQASCVYLVYYRGFIFLLSFFLFFAFSVSRGFFPSFFCGNVAFINCCYEISMEIFARGLNLGIRAQQKKKKTSPKWRSVVLASIGITIGG